MPGGNLAERDRAAMASSGDWRAVVQLMLKVTRAVAHAHQHGLVHRDIKPANILLGSAGEPYLADFGIAVSEGDSDGYYTSGTPAYMAPEQASGEGVTTLADVYSLGALMYDLMTGLLPVMHVKDLAFSDTGRYLVMLKGSGNGWHDLLVYDMGNLKKIFEMKNVQRGFAVRGDRLACMSVKDDLMLLTQLADPSKRMVWAAGTDVSRLVFSFDGQELLGLTKDGRELLYWDAPTGKLHNREYLDGDSYRAIDVYQGGVVMAGSRQRIDFCLGTKRLEGRWIRRGHVDEILSLSVSPDARWLVSGGKDRSVRLWKMPGRNGFGDKDGMAVTGLVAHNGRGDCFLSETKEGNVYVRSAGERLIKLGDDEARRGGGFSPAGDDVWMWKEGRGGITLEWWEASTGKRLRESRLDLPFKGPFQVKVSGDRRTFVVKGKGTPVLFHDLESLQLIGELPMPKKGDTRIELSHDGRKVAFVFWPRRVIVGEIGKGWLPKVDLTKGNLGPLRFSPDGKWLISGNDENCVMIHDAETGELIQSLTGHHQRVNAISVSPDGRTIASSSDDQTLRLWHVPTWRELGILKDGAATRYYLGFDDESRRLCIGYWGTGGSTISTVPKLPVATAEKQ